MIDDLGIKISCKVQRKKVYITHGRLMAWLRRKILRQWVFYIPARLYRKKV